MEYTFKHIFFIGIGGISMSGLAELMLHRNIKVSGSDSRESLIVEKLRNQGAKVYIGHNGNNISSDVDVVVYTSAVNEENVEMIRAKELGLKIYSRAEFLGMIMLEHDHSIAISGTHGKTTTTGMVSSILLASPLDPTIFLGGEMDIIDGNIKIGNGDLLLTEACEYKRNFLNFFPTIEVILNIDEDHLDYYKDIDDIRSAFVQFAKKTHENGLVIVNNNDKKYFKDVDRRILCFGIKNDDDMPDIYAENIKYVPNPEFDVIYKGQNIGSIKLKVFGEHNIINSLSAIAVGIELGLEFDIIKKGLESFVGTKRRYEYKGKKNDVMIIDDYAHHPTEIKATLTCAREMTKGKVITIFQPHTYTRTYKLLSEFAKALSLSDEVIILDIYAAREPDTGLISSKDLVSEIKKYNQNAIYAENFEISAKLALDSADKDDIIIAMGAGSVEKVPSIILNC